LIDLLVWLAIPVPALVARRDHQMPVRNQVFRCDLKRNELIAIVTE
jgi:hypothetical protein